MAPLSTKQRNNLPNGSFAGPNRSYPINNASHARNALSRVSQFGNPAEKARVDAAVHRKFPGIGNTKKKAGPHSAMIRQFVQRNGY